MTVGETVGSLYVQGVILSDLDNPRTALNTMR